MFKFLKLGLGEAGPGVCGCHGPTPGASASAYLLVYSNQTDTDAHSPSPPYYGTVYRQVLIQSHVVIHRKPYSFPIVSDLKEKASQVKSAGIKSYGTAREKLSTQTSSTTTGRAKPPPPPPPRRVSSPSSSSSNQRSSFAGRAQASATRTPSGATTDDVEKIDWANLSAEDKHAFFAWLDEFFARYLNGSLPPSTAHALPISTNSSSNNTPAPSPSPRPSPSIPHRRVSSRASQSTGPDLQDEVAPAAGRRNLPPMLSQQGPVCPLFLCQLSNIAEVVAHSQRSSILQNLLQPQNYQKRLYQTGLHIPQTRIRVRFLLPPFFLSSLI